LDALVTYERSLVTPNARFDRYLRNHPEALSPVELIMELWHGHDPLPPAGGAKRWQIQTLEEEQPRLRLL
jgi:hypothetical protein